MIEEEPIIKSKFNWPRRIGICFGGVMLVWLGSTLCKQRLNIPNAGSELFLFPGFLILLGLALICGAILTKVAVWIYADHWEKKGFSGKTFESVYYNTIKNWSEKYISARQFSGMKLTVYTNDGPRSLLESEFKNYQEVKMIVTKNKPELPEEEEEEEDDES
jgi:hypothetical protein